MGPLRLFFQDDRGVEEGAVQRGLHVFQLGCLPACAGRVPRLCPRFWLGLCTTRAFRAEVWLGHRGAFRSWRGRRSYGVRAPAVLDLIGLTQRYGGSSRVSSFSAGLTGVAIGFTRDSHYLTFQMA